MWPFASLRAPGPRAHYDYRHSNTLRNTFNRMLSRLSHCLQNRKAYDELAAFPHRRSMRLSQAS